MRAAWPLSGAVASAWLLAAWIAALTSLADARSYVVDWQGGLIRRAFDTPAPVGNSTYELPIRGPESFHAIDMADGGSTFQCSESNRAPCRIEGTDEENDCRRANVRCDSNLFKDKVSGPWIPCCEKQHLFNLLVWFHNTVADKVDVSGSAFWYSLFAGTALASKRGGGLIDWDTDIDIAVPKTSETWLLERLQQAAKKEDPPYVARHDPEFENLIRVFASEKNTLHIDVWLTDTQGDAPCAKIGPLQYTKFEFFPLQGCILHGREFPCWPQVDKYLDMAYGRWNESGTYSDNKQLNIDC